MGDKSVEPFGESSKQGGDERFTGANDEDGAERTAADVFEALGKVGRRLAEPPEGSLVPAQQATEE